MKRCEKSDECGFFNDRLEDMPPIAQKLKEWFCEKDKDRCARYMVDDRILRGYSPSSDVTLGIIKTAVSVMHPNDYEKADLIIRSLRKNAV